MDNVVDFQDYKRSKEPHVIIETQNTLHIIPVECFKAVLDGRIEFENIDDHKEIMKVILSQWLSLLE